jgi:predicted nucleotidyltransferase
MPMNKEQILSILRAHETELHRRGVKHAALFGSVARGDERSDSDIDILIELEPNERRTSFGYAGIKRIVADLFPGPVDVVDRKRLPTPLRENVYKDLVDAF